MDPHNNPSGSNNRPPPNRAGAHGRLLADQPIGAPTPFNSPNTGRRMPHSPLPTKIINSKVYKVIKVLQAPTEDSQSMSHGVSLVESPSGALRVEKCLQMTSAVKRERAEQEKSILERLRSAGASSANINVLYEAFWPESSEHATFLLEYCDRGTVEAWIHAHADRDMLVSEDFCWHLYQGLAAALCMCHYGIRDPERPELGIRHWDTICHLDIKPCNVFLSTIPPCMGTPHAKWPRVVLGDFGCAITRNDIITKRWANDRIPYGTLGWYPPENSDSVSTQYNGRYGKPTDIWQMGGVIQAVCRQIPEPDMFDVDGGIPCGSSYSKDLSNTVRCCMGLEQEMRPTSVDVFAEVKKLRGYRAQGVSR